MIKEALWMDRWDGMGWMDGIVIIGRRLSKGTFGANNGIKPQMAGSIDSVRFNTLLL